MFKPSSAAMLWSLSLGAALLVGCSKEEDKSTGTGGAGGSATTRPTTQPGMGDMDRTAPGRGPTTRPGEDASSLVVPSAPDLTGTPGTPGTPTLPDAPAIPGLAEAEAAAGRVVPSTRPGTRPTTLPGGITLPGVPSIPDPDNK